MHIHLEIANYFLWLEKRHCGHFIHAKQSADIKKRHPSLYKLQNTPDTQYALFCKSHPTSVVESSGLFLPPASLYCLITFTDSLTDRKRGWVRVLNDRSWLISA